MGKKLMSVDWFFFALVVIAIWMAFVICQGVWIALARGEEVISGSFTITDYASNKYAMDDDKMRQLDEKFPQIENSRPSQEGYILKILVYGSADITGPSAENDPLSENRAKPVAAILRHRLPPGTEVEVVPRGDTENERQVRVEWKYVPMPVKPATAPTVIEKTVVEKPKSINLVLWIAALVIVVAIAIISFRTASRRLEKKTIAASKDSEVSVIEYFPYSMDGWKYSVRVKRKGKIYTLPFSMLDGSGLQTKEDRDGVKKTIHWYFRNWKKGKPPFAEEVNELIKKGVIKN